jgi:hypothetical protein
MRNTVTIFATLVMIAALFSGCRKSDVQETDAAEESKSHSVDDGQDHSGHNH